MRTVTLAGSVLAIGLAGLVGCSARVPILQPRGPSPEEEARAAELARKREASRFQQEVVMAEVARTHPVLSATLDRDLYRLRAAIRKNGKVNEVRRDMRLGPPLREACRLRWKEGIDELTSHGAKCLGDAQCESCLRSHWSSGTSNPANGSRQSPRGGVRPTP